MEYPLLVQNLSKFYGDFCAVNNISFTLNPGEIFGLLGKNGAGKTTTISMINTLENINQGHISIFGIDVKKNSIQAKSILGVVPQETLNHSFFTVEEVLHFQAGFFGLKDYEVWLELLLDKFDLASQRKKKAYFLSGGMKKRLAIVKALLHKPKLLLLDEPTASVDIELREVLWDFILELKQQGISILLTTHYLEEAEALCDRIGIIDHGKLILVDETDSLIENHAKKKITLSFYEKPHLHSEYLTDIKDEALTFSVPARMSFAELVKELDINLTTIKDVQMHKGSLEEAFRYVIQNDESN